MSNNDLILEVLIEIPKGCRNKYEYDKERNMIKFDRTLFSSVYYPSDYGFVPDTLSEDGDPLDVLVLVNQPTFPGCLIDAKPIGLFVMYDEKGRDDKILCVPVSDPLWNHINTLEQVPPHLLDEIEHFFSIYKDLEQKSVRVEGWQDKQAAIEVINEALRRYQDAKTNPKRKV
ncbi:MAG: inorganic diphosphatase [Clostridia bacterium]|jgi:inorganic pyrophosphatase|nr:inorganic diphosphatase [Clostridia bacterium]MBT7122008.1 inorganic diphosphatase [Clostridia bacterium]